MTDDIKDIVDGLQVFADNYSSMTATQDFSVPVIDKAIAALTTLSEDNAAMKLEIELYKDLYEDANDRNNDLVMKLAEMEADHIFPPSPKGQSQCIKT